MTKEGCCGGQSTFVKRDGGYRVICAGGFNGGCGEQPGFDELLQEDIIIGKSLGAPSNGQERHSYASTLMRQVSRKE